MVQDKLCGIRLVVDASERLSVPPDNPRYVLKRVWLTEDEERAY